jgi:hypothetical protein
MDIEALPITEQTWSAIQAEAISALIKHGDRSVGGPLTTEPDRLAILGEEFGEVCSEFTYDRSGDKDKLIKELIQVAATASMWIEVLVGNRG